MGPACDTSLLPISLQFAPIAYNFHQMRIGRVREMRSLPT